MEGGNGLPTIKREQIVSMNQHYRRFSLDYYLECQEKLGVENIEFWLGASHFYVDSKGYEAIQPVRKNVTGSSYKGWYQLLLRVVLINISMHHRKKKFWKKVFDISVMDFGSVQSWEQIVQL